VLCWCTSEACKCSIRNAILRRPQWLFAQLQYWLRKAYCRSCTYSIERFTSAFAGKFMSKWWNWSKVEAWNFTVETFKTCQFNESRLLFVDLNLSTIVREKAPEICTFHGWWFKNRKHKKCLNVETRLLFSPALINFLATRLVALLVFTKTSCGLFLIWSMWWLLAAADFIYRNWLNLNWLSQFFSISVSIWAQLAKC